MEFRISLGRLINPELISADQSRSGPQWVIIQSKTDPAEKLLGGGRSTAKSTPRSTQWSTWLGQVDCQVEPKVDLALAGIFRLACFDSDFRISNFLKSVLNFLKLPMAITSSYDVHFTQTRTLFQPEFRDEHNGATHFP